MGGEFEIRGAVRGTPRTYGDSRTEDVWRRAVVEGDWAGHEGLRFPLQCEIELQYRFAIHAPSLDYGGAPHPNGRDLDTLVVQSSTSAALLAGRNAERLSLRWIADARLVRRVVASKHLVSSDTEAGVEILIRPPGRWPPPCQGDRVLGFQVPEAAVRELGLAAAVKKSVSAANQTRITFSKSSRIALKLAFTAAQRPFNLLSEVLLEKTIDAVGAAPVGARRLFEETVGSRPGSKDDTDDSIVFALIAEKADSLPPSVLLRGVICQAPLSDETGSFEFLR